MRTHLKKVKNSWRQGSLPGKSVGFTAFVRFAMLVLFVITLTSCSSKDSKGFFEIVRIEPSQVGEIEINWHVVSEEEKNTYLSLLSNLRLEAIYHFGDHREKPWNPLLSGRILLADSKVGHEFSITSERRMIINNSYYQVDTDAIRKILEFGGKSTAYVSSADSPVFQSDVVNFEIEGENCDNLIELVQNTCGEKVLQYEGIVEAPEGGLHIYIRDKFGKAYNWSYISENRVVLDDALYSAKLEDIKSLFLFLKERHQDAKQKW